MAFHRRNNRRIVVGGETYLWCLKSRYVWSRCGHIAVRHSNTQGGGQLLLLDFSAFAFEIRPKTIREAIEFALANGWSPTSKAKPLYIGFDNVNFVVLGPGEQYLSVWQHPPSMTWIQPTNEGR